MKPVFKRFSLLLAILMVLTVFTGQLATSAKATEISNQTQTFSAGAYHSIFIWPDGSVGAVGYSDKGRCDVADWENIISVSASSHTVGLRADGTVVATGPNGYGQCEVSNWSNIVAIAAGVEHTVGLCANGAVVAVGKKDNDRCDVSDWEDIVAIAAGNANTYGLKSNGKVLAVGSNASGQKDVSSWNNIQQISAGNTHVVGLKENGTVVAAGNNSHGQCDVSNWKDIVAISAGHHFTLGLKADGTVVSTGDNSYGQCNVRGWTNIVAISAGQIHSIGLCSDGTLVSTGSNAYGQCNIDKDAAILTTADRNTLFPIAGDVVQVVVNRSQCAVLRTDGTVRVIGDNTYGQCDTTHWQDVVKIWVDLFVTFGLTKDGTVLATNGEYSDWTDVRNLFILESGCSEEAFRLKPPVVAVKNDGSVIAEGYLLKDKNLASIDFSGWSDVVDIQVPMNDNMVGLKENGSLLMLDENGETIEALTNVASLFASEVGGYLFAITEQGDVYLCAPWETAVQDTGWKDIKRLAVRIPGVIYGITNTGNVLSGIVHYNSDIEEYYHAEGQLSGFRNIREIGTGRMECIWFVTEDGKTEQYPENVYDLSDWTGIQKFKEWKGDYAAALKEDGTLLFENFSSRTYVYDSGDIADFWMIDHDALLILTQYGKIIKWTVPDWNEPDDAYSIEEIPFLTTDVKS